MLTAENIAIAKQRCPDITKLYFECIETTPFGRAPMICRGLRRRVLDCSTDNPFYQTLLDAMKDSTAEERSVIISNLKKSA